MELTVTQRMIEEQFCHKAFYSYLDEELKYTLDLVYEANTLELLSKATSINNIDLLTDMLKEIILILGNPNNGLQRQNGTRSFKVSHLVSLFSSLEYLQHDDINQTYLKAFQIVEELDGILFEVQKFTSKIDESEDDIYIIVDWEIGQDALQYQGLTRYKLPMIEKPKQWKTNKSGGYLLSNDKVTLKRGEGEQPQRPLNFLNDLQGQKWTLNKIDIQEQKEYLRNKFEKKGMTEGEIQRALTVSTLTLEETYDHMKDNEFYLTWKFDFRGRAYSQGYDINLQGDSYKKGMLRPVFEYTEAEQILNKYEG